jgi:hypothetical protein
MKMLILRSGRAFDQVRACVPLVRTKSRKYGAVLEEPGCRPGATG